MGSKQGPEPQKIIGLKYTPAGILKRVSTNVYLMDADFSEPTGEGYFKTDPEYDRLPPDPDSEPKPKVSSEQKAALRPTDIVQISENVWTAPIDFSEPSENENYKTKPAHDHSEE